MPNETNTMFFICPSSMSKGKKAPCMRLVPSLHPLKIETHWVHITTDGNRLEHEGFISTITVPLPAINIHLNSTISTPNARHLTLAIKDYYYGTPMHECEHTQIPCSLIPQEIID